MLASRDDWDAGKGLSRSKAVGSESFVNTVAKKLGYSLQDHEKQIGNESGTFSIREPSAAY